MIVLTGLQLRAARSALGWSAEVLAGFSGVSQRTIARFESVDGPLSAQPSTLRALKAAFTEAGIEFIGTPDDGPGIRLRRKAPSA